jgi:hypothetical protein
MQGTGRLRCHVVMPAGGGEKLGPLFERAFDFRGRPHVLYHTTREAFPSARR